MSRAQFRLLRGSVVLVALAMLGAMWAGDAFATAPYAPKRPPLLTPWTRSVSSITPRSEYPRPQLQRDSWQSLNGRWQYEQAQTGQSPPFGQNLAQTILVPFPVQSPLSGIERGDQRGWYRRRFTIPSAWQRRRVLLNFGAVGWAAVVYVNGRLAGSHLGDYDSFSLDITRLLHRGGSNELLVGFYDPVGGADEPVGKQVPGTPGGYFHTASSGIWQTVWLEPVASTHISGLRLTPDVRRGRLLIDASTTASGTLVAQALVGGRIVASALGPAGRTLALRIDHARLWSPRSPFLYGLRLRLVTHGRTVDRVRSYFGMRSISLGRVGGVTRMLLNGRFVFQTGALDQGYWPDGVYTAPTDAADRFDILAAKRLGYNMLREHQKVQDDRWYYWADRLGLLVWQDMPSLPISHRLPPTSAGKAEFRRELRAIVIQRRSHPSIVTWIPFNEGWDQFAMAPITRQLKRLDRASLVDTDSGSANCCNAVEERVSDIRDAHLYFGPFAVRADRRASVIGEYGGVLAFPPAGHIWPATPTSIGSPALSWPVSTVTQFLRQQYADLEQEMRVQGLSGAAFTELGAYEQELGIVSYDRRVYTMPPALVRRFNAALIRNSQRSTGVRPQRAGVPRGSSGLWRFDAGRGATAGDSSGHGHALTLRGAAWTHGVHGSALAITGPGRYAVANANVIDTVRSFTVSAWLNSARAGQSGTAVSEPGPSGSSFSLGIQTAPQGAQSLGGEVGRQPRPAVGDGTWWTFVVPEGSSCDASRCGVRANARYGDARFDPRVGSWYQVTGVYDRRTATLSLYVDGVPEDVEHVGAVPSARGPLIVGQGAGNYAPTDSFTGAIDQLRTYPRALAPPKVWQLYRAEHAASRRS